MDIFSALADSTRRNIIELLYKSGQLTATDIYQKFTATPPAISQHLKVLKDANLVTMEKKAQKHIYKINPEAKGWIKKMMALWNERFERLNEVLKSEK